MNNKTLLEKYRDDFSVGILLTVIVAGIIEILAYIIFINIGESEFSHTDAYLQYKVILPIVINCAIYIIVSFINHSSGISHNAKNKVIVYGASAVAFVISVIHREFIVNTGSFMFPMILSAVFNDQKLITRTFVISLLSTTVTVIFSWYDGFINVTNLINYIVMYGFLTVSFFACFISIKYSQLQLRLIESQAEANGHLRNIVLLDQMTGLYNHRTFYKELDLAIRRQLQEKKDFCLAVIDIDNFKHINDLYGHDCGDIVINNLADVIKASCETGDMAFRYGGEEFAIIFADKTLDEAENILKAILEGFSETKYDFTDKRITFSAGVSKYAEAASRETFFAFVDKLMYSAKKNGRNQIKAALCGRQPIL